MLSSAVVRGRPNPRFKGFPTRLRRARRAAKLSYASLSREAGLGTSATAYALERGENIPRLDTVEKLARALNISPCFLAFGVEPSCEPAHGMLCAGLPQRLRSAREALSLSMREIGRRSDTSATLVSSAESGATMPNLAKLEALAKALGVSPCWLAYGVGAQAMALRRRARTPSQRSMADAR